MHGTVRQAGMVVEEFRALGGIRLLLTTMQTVLYTMKFLSAGLLPGRISAEIAMPWEPSSKRTKGQP
jgi:hypothetical protein